MICTRSIVRNQVRVWFKNKTGKKQGDKGSQSGKTTHQGGKDKDQKELCVDKGKAKKRKARVTTLVAKPYRNMYVIILCTISGRNILCFE